MARNQDRARTVTSTILEALMRADDFLTAPMVQQMTRIESHLSVQATLHYLQVRGAVECFESGGTLWWFATPDGDNRVRRMEYRIREESRKSSPRRKRSGGKPDGV